VKEGEEGEEEEEEEAREEGQVGDEKMREGKEFEGVRGRD